MIIKLQNISKWALTSVKYIFVHVLLCFLFANLLPFSFEAAQEQFEFLLIYKFLDIQYPNITDVHDPCVYHTENSMSVRIAVQWVEIPRLGIAVGMGFCFLFSGIWLGLSSFSQQVRKM